MKKIAVEFFINMGNEDACIYSQVVEIPKKVIPKIGQVINDYTISNIIRDTDYQYYQDCKSKPDSYIVTDYDYIFDLEKDNSNDLFLLQINLIPTKL